MADFMHPVFGINTGFGNFNPDWQSKSLAGGGIAGYAVFNFIYAWLVADITGNGAMAGYLVICIYVFDVFVTKKK